ncbi:MAG: DUF4304 domain-containing protein [Actinomycetota bacterium]
MVTAQENFRRMMTAEVAPALRRLGFKGSGQSFTMPSEDFWILLGFQKSTSSNSAEVRFTLNVSVGSKSAWKEARKDRSYLPERPSANVYWGTFIWQERIGRLLHSGQGQWWRVSADSSTDEIADQVLAAVRDYVLPAIERHVADSP